MPDLFLPPGVHYACVRCGACCRGLEVTLTEPERDRLAAQDWSRELPGYSPKRLFARRRGARGKHVWRLRPRRDGACPFLAEDNLCRVHATLGYAAKPFAGRVFPFSFVATPVGIFVGCRFSCPAVARGEGPPLEDQRRDIQRLFDEYAQTYDPPREPDQMRFFGHFKLAWRDVLRIEDQLVAFLVLQDLHVARRLMACWLLVRQFVSTALRRGQGERMGVDPDAILARVRGDMQGKRLSRMERVLLRLVVAAFVGAAAPAAREMTILRRTGLRLASLRRRLKMALGVGRVRLPGLALPVRMREVARLDLTELCDDSSAMLQRYFVAKLASQGFFGRVCFGRSFAEGFEALALAYSAAVWLAGAHALAAGRRSVEPADIKYGIRQVDYGYNYSRELGGLAARARGALLWHWGTAGKALLTLSASTRPGK